MATVSPSQSSPGNEITAAAINTPINQLAAVINGSVDANNLADSAVSTNKIADSAVTAVKIDYTTVPALKAYRVTSIQSLPTTGPVAISFNGEVYKNITGMHSTTTTPERLIATKAGVYAFTYTLNQSSGYVGGRVIVSYSRYNSGGTLQETAELWDGSTDAGEPSRSFSWMSKMAVSDYVSVFVHCAANTGGADFSTSTTQHNAVSMTYLSNA